MGSTWLSTAKTHLCHTYMKLGVSSRSSAVKRESSPRSSLALAPSIGSKSVHGAHRRRLDPRFRRQDAGLHRAHKGPVVALVLVGISH